MVIDYDPKNDIVCNGLILGRVEIQKARAMPKETLFHNMLKILTNLD
jgi:hypothetical protein